MLDLKTREYYDLKVITSSWSKLALRMIQWISLFLLIATIVVKFFKGSVFFYSQFGFYPSRSIYASISFFLAATLFEKRARLKFIEYAKQIWTMEMDKKVSHNYKFRLTLLNFFSLLVFLFLHFALSQRNYFKGTDGTLQLSLNQLHKKMGDSPFYFSSNFLQGLGGNVPFPFNHAADPGLSLIHI